MLEDSLRKFFGDLIPMGRPPFFFAVLAPHILAGIAAVIAGAVAMLAPKARGRHSRAGKVYYWSLGLLVASATVMAALRLTEDAYLFCLGAGSFLGATLARWAVRRPGRGYVRIHILGMGLSYTLLLIAFYLDNGGNIAVWKDMPRLAYWLLPGVLGAFFTLRAVFTHPLSAGRM